MRPYGPSFQTRSVVMGRHGMVASSHPWATQCGLDVLRQGGNAVDAAIAVNAMLGLVEPMSCGIGGDLFALVWDDRTKRIHGLNASGRSPGRASADALRAKGSTISTYGPDSWTVPGCVRGWQALLEKFGSRSLDALLRPAIATAREGFPVTEIIAGYWKSGAPRLRGWPDSAATYLIGGHSAPEAGDLFRNPNLASTYERLANQGPEEFYSGSIAREIVAFSDHHQGLFSLEDFAAQTADWVTPVRTSYRGSDVWQIPPNGQGITVLQMLNILESFDLSKLRFGSAEHLHLLIEAKRLAYADRAAYLAEANAMTVPVDGLISKAYGKSQASRIQLDRVNQDIPPGMPGGHSDTVYLSVVDEQRNACSLIQSIFHGFGSQMVPGKLGFALQNRGSGFSLQASHPNCLAPRKRPFHTIIPGMVTRDDKPWFCFGVMGGDMQPQGQVQVLVNLLDFAMNIQAAGDAPRIQHTGSASPNGEEAQGLGTVVVERGIDDQAVEGLRARGHQVSRGPGNFGGYQGILIDWERGLLHGASESRKDGCALGY